MSVEPEIDPLSAACSRAGVDATRVIAWLGAELGADRFARLEQAGDSAENKIPLAQVFIDLDVSASPSFDGPSRRFLRDTLQRQPKQLGEEQTPGEKKVHHGAILVGGPGQGKSTLSQLLCQVHRAKLLAPHAASLDTTERSVVSAFSSLNDLGVSEVQALFPLRIVLADAAAWLATEAAKGVTPKSNDLLRFLAAQSSMLGAEDLLRLVAATPWLMVLDGLDEVPSSLDRERVLGAVRALLALFREQQQEGVVLATTRPQGYSGELEELGIALDTLHLAPLSDERALSYADKLVQMRYGHAAERRKKVMERLRQALSVESTARLLRSPLQVTIMATLVDRIGRAPTERWSLFKEYYRVIYEREMERPIPAAALLRSHRPYVDKIHMHIGLLLQVEAEREGGAEATMSKERFEGTVDALLQRDDNDASRRAAIVQALSKAVQDRLVLLVEPKPGKLGFEIRSIQEFFAAWALANKDEGAVVLSRIERVAPIASYRNVVLFWASKCFTELSDLRDAIVERLCPGMNQDKDDPLVRAALPGSQLALEILEEGSALYQPRYAEQLMEISLDLLALPPGPVHLRLAALASPELAPLVQTALHKRLNEALPEARLGAWVTLLALVDKDTSWAKALAEERWPTRGEERRDIVRACGNMRKCGEWLAEKVHGAMDDFPPDFLNPWTWDFKAQQGSWSWKVSRIAHVAHGRDNHPVTSGRAMEPLSLTFISVREKKDPGWTEIAKLPQTLAHWRPWLVSAQFIALPSAAALSKTLLALVEVFNAALFRWSAPHVPWPIGACLYAAVSPEELVSFAGRAANGDFGDLADWLAAEERWRSQGIDLSEVLRSAELQWPIGRDIGLWGAPAQASRCDIVLNSETVESFFSDCRRSLRDLRSSFARHLVASSMMEILSAETWRNQPIHRSLSPDEVASLHASLDNSLDKGMRIDALLSIKPWEQPGPGWAKVLDQIGHSHGFSVSELSNVTEVTRYLSSLYVEDPLRTGLLRILALLTAVGARPEVPPALLDHGRLEDPHYRRAASLIRLAQGNVTLGEMGALVSDLLGASKGGFQPARQVQMIVEHAPVEAAFRERFLAALWEHAPKNDWVYAQALATSIQTVLRQRQADLSDPDIWDRLSLPLPRPNGKSRSDKPPPSGGTPLRIERIEVQNLRIFDQLSIKPFVPPADRGQWVVLLGENGAGKTTLLRGLTFALIDATRPGLLPKPAFEAPWRRSGIVENDTCSAEAFVNGVEYRAEFRDRLNNNITPRDHFFAAYGCKRGSSIGGAAREVRFDPGDEIATLFDESAPLIHAETWLMLRELDALKRPNEAAALYTTVIAALKAILPGVGTIESRRVMDEPRMVAVSENGREVLLSALSDGYLTMLGWMVDLLARWIDRVERRGGKIEEGFTKTMTGIVLIDEIDLLLHPTWQLHVISDVKRIFPKLSFIVTTHSPLTLVGARAEEIWTLERGPEGRVIAEQGKALPELLTGSGIYQRYFGVGSVFPSEMGQKLRRYGLLAGNPGRSPEEDREMQALLAELRERDMDPGWDPVPREGREE